MTALTFEHFAQVEEALCAYYGRTANAMGCTFAYQALLQAAPSITQELWDLGVSKALANSKWKPSLSDVLATIYERKTDQLPPLPDIDPRHADAYQQGLYWRAVATRQKLLESAPVDPTAVRTDVAAELQGRGHALPPGVAAVDGKQRLLEPSPGQLESSRPEARVFRAGDQQHQVPQLGAGLQLTGW
jgi:hypothetical protein